MASQENGSRADPSADDRAEGSVVIGLKQVVDAVVELNIARKNMFIYPPEHAQVELSIQKAHQTMAAVLEAVQSITLGVTGKSLMIEIEQPGRTPVILPVDPSHAVCRGFSGMLKSYHIATVKFFGDLDQEALSRFLSLLTRPAEEIEAAGGIEKAADGAGLVNIELAAVDYSKFQYSDEKQISRRGKSDAAGEKNLWEAFVSHLISETLSDEKTGIDVELLKTADPEKLAMLFNKDQVDTGLAVKAYQKDVDAFFSGGREREEEADPSSLKAWNSLLHQLKADKKRRFLSVPFAHVSRQAASDKATRFLSAMPGGLVVDMLAQADRVSAGEAAPVKALVQKMMDDGDLWTDDRGALEKLLRAPEAGAARSDKVPDREVNAPEDLLTAQEAGATPDSPAADREAFPLEEYLATLEGPQVDIKIARLLSAFLSGDINDKEYRIFAERLVNISAELLDIPDFSQPLSALRVLDSQKKKKESPAIRALAAEYAREMRKPRFVSKGAAAFLMLVKTEEADPAEAFNFLRGLGPAMIPDLVRLYAEDEKALLSKPLVELLTLFKKEAVEYIRRCLDDSRLPYVINLIVLLKSLQAGETGPELRRLLRHENQDVTTAALEALLQFQDQEAMPVLQQMLRSNRADIAAKGISLAGKYRVGELVPELLSRLKRFPLFKSDLARNRGIIKALGQIGDPAAIPGLTRLAGTLWPFSPAGEKKRMMLALFESLSGYPSGDFSRLVVLGGKMSDAKINSICRSLSTPSSRRNSDG